MTTSTTCDHAGHITSFLKTIADQSCHKRLTGIAIGVIVDGQEFSAVGGWADVESNKPVSDSTIFELGSLSKLFTSLLLAVAATKQEVGLDDAVQTALGEQVTLPTDGKSQITYRSLANHRSSLPRLPDDLIATADMENPYAHYDQEMLYACLNRMKSVKPIGSREVYSNLGVGLLGHILGKLAGSDYRTALKERVLVPLGMLATSTESSDEQTAQLATAYKKKNKPTKHWDFTDSTVGAGGVRSSLKDLLKFLRANVYPKSTTLAAELALMREPSELPKCESRIGSFVPNWFSLFMVFAFSSLCATVLVLPQWLAPLGGIDVNKFPGLDRGAFLPYFTIFAATMGAAIRWSYIGGFCALLLTTFLTWRFWSDNFAWITFSYFGVFHIYVGSMLKRYAVDGQGRLAWQDSKIGPHPMLWHNGMVGGSASFLGIVEELEMGVVVLTNTAKSVDAIGVKVLSELVKLNESQLQREKNS